MGGEGGGGTGSTEGRRARAVEATGMGRVCSLHVLIYSVGHVSVLLLSEAEG